MDSNQIRVLLVDDDEEEFRLTRDLLSEIEGTSYRLDWEPGYHEALELAVGEEYDVYLLDYDLGLYTGLDLLKEAMDRGCSAPMILVTGVGDRSVDEAAMKAGAADYLMKGRIDSSQLERSIRYSLSRKRAESERKSLEQQFRQAQKMEAIGQLAGGVAHDFNNLLTAILGYAEIGVIQSTDDGPSKASFEEIRDAARRAADLTKQLLAFSRGQAQQMSVLDLNEVVRNSQEILRRLIGKGVEQRTVLPPGLWLVKSDARQLEQVIINLAINARDAMQLGGRLVIETANTTVGPGTDEVRTGVAAGRYVVMSVSDNGSGIDEEVLPHIFEPFYTTKPVGKGTGLGLSTCYGIVQQSKGHVEAFSEPGAGTTIKVYLPKATGTVARANNPEAPSFQGKGTERVLLVEDEEKVRSMASRVLRDQGYTVLEAENGDDALKLVETTETGAIDLLLTDIIMPIMGGKELADRLLTRRGVGSVLYTSGYAEASPSRFGQLKPGSDFMPKPFSPETLIRRVRQTLDASRLEVLQDADIQERSRI